MILYNTTFIIDRESSPEALIDWAKQRYIPSALALPGVTSHILASIGSRVEESTQSYAIQFVFTEEAVLTEWRVASAILQKELEVEYGKGNVLWFSTEMNILSQSSEDVEYV